MHGYKMLNGNKAWMLSIHLWGNLITLKCYLKILLRETFSNWVAFMSNQQIRLDITCESSPWRRFTWNAKAYLPAKIQEDVSEFVICCIGASGVRIGFIDLAYSWQGWTKILENWFQMGLHFSAWQLFFMNELFWFNSLPVDAKLELKNDIFTEKRSLTFLANKSMRWNYLANYKTNFLFS